MSEWWTYRLSNFLLFSPRTYYRLFELYNAAIWPAQVLAFLAGAGILVLLYRGGPARDRWIHAVLSACWLWSGVAFLLLRYAKINWAATYFAWAFGAEAALLAWAAVRSRPGFEPAAKVAGRAGLSLFVFALAALPLAAPILGRGWRSAEVFGLAPDPTAVGTLGLVLLARAPRRWLLMIVPSLWCVVTGVTLFAMHSPDFWIPPAAAVLSVALAARRAPAAGSPRTSSVRATR